MPVATVAIRDASLTTQARVIQSISAFRLNYPNTAGFPVGNAFLPEQFRNTVSAEVPLLASQGTCQCDQSKVLDFYGFQPPSNVSRAAGNA